MLFELGFGFQLGFCVGSPPAFRVKWVVKWRLFSSKLKKWIFFILFLSIGPDGLKCLLSFAQAHQDPYHDVFVLFARRVNVKAQFSTDVRYYNQVHLSDGFVLSQSGKQATVLLTSGVCVHSLHNGTSRPRELFCGRVLK